jgi:predicted lipoprotein with Yx(FWY)xxD motif
MKKSHELKFALTVASLALLLVGCSTQQASQQQPYAPAPTTDQTQQQPAANAPVPAVNIPVPTLSPYDVMTASNPTLGPIFVSGNGMTLYTYSKDAKDKSNCYDVCATNWPPLLTSDTPKIAKNLIASKFGVTIRTDGDKQVTFEGMPLYFWIKDAKPGDTTGQGVGGVWSVYKIGSDDLVDLNATSTKAK